MRRLIAIVPLAFPFVAPAAPATDRLLDTLGDHLVDRPLLPGGVPRARPVRRDDLDSTTVGKSGHLVARPAVAAFPPQSRRATGASFSASAAPRRPPHFRGVATARATKESETETKDGLGTAATVAELDKLTAGIKGLPWWWDYVWKLPIAKRGNPGEPLVIGDTMHVFRTNIEQMFADQPSVDGAPMAEGSIDGLVDGTMYLALQRMYNKVGSIYKLCFGPKSFMVVSDPVIMKHILQGNTKSYDKGVLAEILEPIMGKGLIPADAETWKIRRRAIVPGFHQKWIERMVLIFGEQTVKATKYLDEAAATGKTVDVEERLGSLALDIIGRAIFDYDFNSTSDESPVVKAAISTLKEAEHRSMTPLPYWNIPFATDIVPRQVKFKKNMALLNDRLDACIKKALENRKEEDVEALQNRDYAAMENPSMLRFMVDMRDEDVTSNQLRDDLMTMLVAGHETTASALTWAIFELVQQPTLLARLQAEVDQELPTDDSLPTLDILRKLKLTRLTIAESLRMYPEPPLLIRRAIEEDTLPEGTGDTQVKLLRGMDLFLSVYNMQRSPLFWDNPDTFDPERFLRKKESTVKGWAGFDPAKWEKQWYPNENAADWAYLPFGGGPRKCVGDQFAMLEATVGLAMLLRRYEFEFAAPTATPDKVGTATGATIHTKNGMWMKVRRRNA